MGKPTHVVITYTNHKDETEERIVRPTSIHFSISTFHDHNEQEWLMEAVCFERNAARTFAMKDITEWREMTEADFERLDALEAHHLSKIPTVIETPLTDEDESM